MFHRSFALGAVLLLCTAAIGSDLHASAARLDDAAITHVLNRLTYGPRPGDVERVRAMGLQNWIDRQLSPARLDDEALNQRLQRLETLTLDSQTIQRDYAAPAMMERRNRKLAEGAENAAAATEAQPMAPATEAQRKSRQVITDLEEAKLLRAVYSERQLEEVLVDFWFNHFNVFA